MLDYSNISSFRDNKWTRTKHFILHFALFSAKHFLRRQECIPVGWVPAARWPYAGVCLLGGMSALGGCLLPGGVCSGGASALGGVSANRGVSALGGVCSWGVCLLLGGCLLWGVSAQGVYPCMHWGRNPSPRGQTDACENITLAQLRCGR